MHQPRTLRGFHIHNPGSLNAVECTRGCINDTPRTLKGFNNISEVSEVKRGVK